MRHHISRMLDQALVDKVCKSSSVSFSSNTTAQTSADMKQYAGAKFDILSKMIRGDKNKLFAYADDFENQEARDAWVGPIIFTFAVPMGLCILLAVWWFAYCIANCCCCKAKDAV